MKLELKNIYVYYYMYIFQWKILQNNLYEIKIEKYMYIIF